MLTSIESIPAGIAARLRERRLALGWSRATLADALRRVRDAGIPLDGAADHGVSEAVYLHDPDGNGIELSYDRPRETWFDAAGRPILKADRIPVESI